MALQSLISPAWRPLPAFYSTGLLAGGLYVTVSVCVFDVPSPLEEKRTQDGKSCVIIFYLTWGHAKKYQIKQFSSKACLNRYNDSSSTKAKELIWGCVADKINIMYCMQMPKNLSLKLATLSHTSLSPAKTVSGGHAMTKSWKFMLGHQRSKSQWVHTIQ